jgi:hypothetical protein
MTATVRGAMGRAYAGLKARLTFAAAVAALAFAAAGPAGAVILATGDNALTGTTAAAEPDLAGTVVQDILTPITLNLAGGVFTGDVQSRVVLAADGTYDFYWRVRETSYTGTDGDGLGNFRIGNFGMPIAGLNGNYRTDGLGDQGPDNAHVFDGALSDFVNFEFDPLQAPNESFFMFLDTNSHTYGLTAEMDFANLDTTLDSGVVPTFGVATVPEPAEWALMIAGFGLTGAALRARRRLALA